MYTNQSELSEIYNQGERLVPGETHDTDEVIRHKSSYEFFYKIIEEDILKDPSILTNRLKIADIGSGTGHGTFMLSKLPGVNIIGVEPGFETVQYARRNYSANNIEYINTNLDDFLKMEMHFDYIVSRHALEHIIEGLDKILEIPYSKRLIVNVPFNENDKNPFHLINWITEENFHNYKNKEFFYESMTGETSTNRTPDNIPNSIVCVSSASRLAKIRDILNFPFPAWQPDFLQSIALDSDRKIQLSMDEAKLNEHSAKLKQLETLLDEKKNLLDAREKNLKLQIQTFNSNKLVRFLNFFGLFRSINQN